MKRISFGTARSLFLLFLVCLTASAAWPADRSANRLSYLDDPIDPYYVGRDFARLTTRQWLGEPGVEAVVVLAIDDMRDPARYEAFLRPILDRLTHNQGRASLSIMTNRVDPQDSQLQLWLREGVNIDVHTLDHPCPLLCESDFTKAKQTYDGCVDLMCEIPGNRPVAFRMPCCDSMNSPSPRFYEAVFERVTSQGNYLTIDSSVFNITTDRDPDLTNELTIDADGRQRFRKYLPFPSFVNTIEDYPYPYVIGRMCWEFPCIVPSDWEAQNLHQPNNPQTVKDLQTALDVVVRKQGVMNLVFHPHGWIRNDQVVQLIDYAAKTYGPRVKFLSFRDAQRQLDSYLLAGTPLRSAEGQFNGVRLLDVNQDGLLDVVRHDSDGRLTTRVWNLETRRWATGEQRLPAVSLHFGLLQADGPVAMVAVTAEQLQLWRFDDGRWQQRGWSLPISELTAKWQAHLQAPAELDAVRLRDLDADGRCEVLLGKGTDSLILRQQTIGWRPHSFGLPAGVRLAAERGRDAGLRWVDLDGDGRDECLFSDPGRFSVHRWLSWDEGWQAVMQGERKALTAGARQIPPFVRPDGTNNGVWAHSGHLWWQNEDTARLPDKVDRLAFAELLGESDRKLDLGAVRSSERRADNRASETDRAPQFPGPLDTDAALRSFHSSVGARVELAAAEPLIADPIAFDWAPDGRLFVVEMRDYPEAPSNDSATSPALRGRVRVLWDDDQDGHYDRAETFLDGLGYPTGIKVWREGVLISGAPEIILATDTDGDHRADRTEVLFHGFGEGNQQHRINGLRWGIDNWLYLANGDSGGRVSSFAGGEPLNLGGRDLRIDPDTGRMQLVSGQTQYGRARDDLGNWFGGNNSDPLWHYVLEDRYLRRNPHFAPPPVRQPVPEMPGPAPVFPASPTLPRFNDFDRADRFTSACGPLLVRDSGYGPPGSTDSFVCEPVHNLIHRETVSADGLSFRSQRAPEDREAEFLASSDNWFRPVLLRIGPDGAIWVADMYRLVIEHTTWIPQHWQQQLDVRAGNDRGRIYRVFPKDRPAVAAFPRLDQLTTEQLVERLDHPNRWQRDTAQQLLLWRADPAAIDPLRQTVQTAQLDVAKMQALYLLDRFAAIEADWLSDVIRHSEPAVARHAVAIAETRLDEHPSVLASVLSRVDTDHLPLRQQLAYSLGFSRDPRAAEALAALAVRQPTDPAISAAVFSSLTPENIGIVFRLVAEYEPRPRQFYRDLLGQCLALGDGTLQTEALMSLLKDDAREEPVWRLATLAELLEPYLRAHRDSGALPPDVRDALEAQVVEARTLASDAQAALSERLAAIEMLRADVDPDCRNRAVLESLLAPRHPPELQSAAGEVLLRQFDESAVASLVSSWTGFSPRTRGRMLDELLSHSELTLALLEAAKENQLDLQLDARRRQRLLASSSHRVREAAGALFVPERTESRDEVIAQYRSSGPVTADRKVGQEVFARACATCHQFSGIGQAVGPDLEALSNKSSDFLLTAILDPNRAVESSFLEYYVETTQGRQFSGILRAETASTVTLLAPEAKQWTILRRDIESMQATGRSLMPDGLEKDISVEQMQHLLAFLTAHQPVRKQFVGNEPHVAPRRDDGSVRLLAMHAEIYGPTLVFEPHYRNLGYWTNPLDYAVWTIELPSEGEYAVSIDYACDHSAAGNRFQLLAADDQLSAEVESTGTWDDYRGRSVGRIRLPGGRSRIMLRSEGPLKGSLMDLHQIVLIPID